MTERKIKIDTGIKLGEIPTMVARVNVGKSFEDQSLDKNSINIGDAVKQAKVIVLHLSLSNGSRADIEINKKQLRQLSQGNLKNLNDEAFIWNFYPDEDRRSLHVHA